MERGARQPFGRIGLTDARVGLAGGEAAVFEAGRLVTELDVFDLIFAGRFTPRRLWLDRGRLVCPPCCRSSASPRSRWTRCAPRSARGRPARGRDVAGALLRRAAGRPRAAFPLDRATLLGSGFRAASGAAHRCARRAGRRRALVALRPTLALLEGASLELSGEDVPGGVKLSLDGLADAIRFHGVEMSAVRLHCGARGPIPGRIRKAAPRSRSAGCG